MALAYDLMASRMAATLVGGRASKAVSWDRCWAYHEQAARMAVTLQARLRRISRAVVDSRPCRSRGGVKLVARFIQSDG
jgi:hypothetical protein